MTFTEAVEKLIRNTRTVSGPLPTPCKVGIEGVDSKGYCMIRVDGAKQKSHRVMWKHYNGDIPEGKLVMHKCDVPSCRAEDHLILGTHQDNMKDRNNKGRQSRLGNSSKVNRKSTWGPHLDTQTKTAIYADQRPQKEIAEAYGIHRNTVCQIKNRGIQ